MEQPAPSIAAAKPAPRTRARVEMPIRLQPARRRVGETIGEFVHRRLRLAIMTGRFPPGLAVTIRGLAAMLGTSSMPVREAMRRLVSERALDLLDNRRARVPAMDEARFAGLVEARILLEVAAARRALPHTDAAALADLRRLDQACNHSVAQGDLEQTIETNFAFHLRLYTQAPNDALTPLIESIWLQIGPFMRAAVQGAWTYYRFDRHAEVLAALAAHDTAALAWAIEADIRDGIGHMAEAELAAIEVCKT